MKYDVIVIGGGAAGLYCAIEAGKRGRRTLVIEHNAAMGRKIIISGGGRCNFTNLHTTHENFVSQNPHFAKSALARHTPADFVSLVRKHGIPYYEKKLGQLFCRDRSNAIVDMLVAECKDAGVRFSTSTTVTKIEKAANFELETSRGRMTASSVVVATGGVSFAKIGATDLGYRIAKQFGLKLTQTRPSLVPLTLERGGWPELAGVSVDSSVSTDGAGFRENILFTHRGMSGPAILQISNYWKSGLPVTIDLLPGVDARELLTRNRASRRRIDNFLADHLPQRFVEQFVSANMPTKPLDQYSNLEIERAASALNGWQVTFAGTEGFDRAEVTLGGVSTAELSSQTMESKKTPGLFFIGEVVDVTGWLGGYNFQWAWSSGFAAGKAV
ncbi:MAG: NAD(P)/FAD-dependent oxidoreductase [Acidobacteriota bacterium]